MMKTCLTLVFVFVAFVVLASIVLGMVFALMDSTREMCQVEPHRCVEGDTSIENNGQLYFAGFLVVCFLIFGFFAVNVVESA